MRVSFDEQIFVMQQDGGISRYFANLIGALTSSGDLGVRPEMHFRYSRYQAVNEAGLAKQVPRLLRNSRALYAMNVFQRIKPAKGHVLHHTFYHPRFLSVGGSAARVTTIHDMAPEVLPLKFSSNPHMAKREFAERSDLILCVSRHTRDLVREIYSGIRAPLVVTPLGVAPEWFRDPDEASEVFAGMQRPTLLYVGSRAGYKDFPCLLRALSLLSSPEVHLVAVGGATPTQNERRMIHQLKLERRVKFVRAADHQLQILYGKSLAFVYPSLHEGFGLTTLEAMASGTRVILANAGAHPEVGGSVAEYFEPGNPEALASRVRDLLGESPTFRRQKLIEGASRAKRFTWSTTAELTATAYKEFL